MTALDFSPRMLEAARVKPGAERVHFVAHDVAGPLPLADRTCDRVLCYLVLEHVTDLEALFRALGRVCREGPRGAIIVSAMHPTMMLRGVQARFHNPRTGVRTQPASLPYQVSNYVMGARRAGLVLEHLSEDAVDEALAAAYPRGARYVGWPMLVREGGGEGATRAWRSERASAGTSCGPTPSPA